MKDRSEYNRRFQLEHKEELREYNRNYYLEHREEKRVEHNSSSRTYYMEHRDRVNVERRRKTRQGYCRDYYRKYNRNLKIQVLTYYGNGLLACVICSESRLDCLTIDHIGGGGNQHRKEIKRLGGHPFYLWLRKQNYPRGYQTLCMNCQFIKKQHSIDIAKK